MRGLLASNALTFILFVVYLIKVSTIVLEQSFGKRSDVTLLSLNKRHTESINPNRDIEKKWVTVIMITSQ